MYSTPSTIVRYALALQHLSARDAIKYGWSIWGFVRREPVRWLELPKFVRRRAHNKGIKPVYSTDRTVLWKETFHAR